MAKLKDLSVSFLSLVKTPATGKGLTLKTKEGQRAQVFEIIKTDDERMVAYGIVYAPDQEDAHGDTASADTIRKACYEFMREGRLKNIDTEHSFTTESAYVCECWLVRKGDELFPSEPEGAWAVGIRIGDPDLWKQLKAGDLTGISLAGIARMEPEPDDPAHPRYTEKDAEPGWVSRLIKALTGADPQDPIEETDMTKDEVVALVTETLKSALPSALKEANEAANGGSDPDTKADAAALEKAKELLKANGMEVSKPSAKTDDDDLDARIAKAIEKAAKKSNGKTEDPEKSLDQKITDAVTKALAKGATETDGASGEVEESFI